MENYLFYNFAGIAVLTAILMITGRSPITSALYLVGCLFSIAALYVLLGAHFVGAAQILVYAGAIMVLFLFVIMLLDLRKYENEFPGKNVLLKAIGVFLALDCLVMVMWKIAGGVQFAPEGVANESYGTTEAVAHVLFTTYLLPFELAGLLLLVAIVGAVVIAKREL
jgi:NADH-quinone oxidoreductase subunit J